MHSSYYEFIAHSSKLWQPDAERPSAVLGKEPGGSTLTLPGVSLLPPAKQTLNVTFAFCLFFLKAKTFFEFLSVSENRYYWRSLLKARWC